MRGSIWTMAVASAALCAARPALAQTCPEGSSWTQTWTDSYGQTTYALEAPCKVYVGIPFQIVATVTDPVWPDGDVGYGWAIVDNGVTVAGGGYLSWITLSGGQWQQVVTQTYTGAPVDHTIQFKFTDLGQGAGAHGWSSSLVGSVTVDPYPNSPPAVEVAGDVTVPSSELAAAVVRATASDPDGDALSFRWLESGAELQPWQPVGASGDASLVLGAIAPLPVGVHALVVEVSDGTHLVSAAATLVVENSPPAASASGAGAYRVGQRVRLGGAVSDFDGDALAWRWLLGTAVVSEGSVAAPAGGAPVALPALEIGPLRPGVYPFVLSVSDGLHEVRTSATVTVAPPGWSVR